MKNPGRKKNIPEKSLLELANYSVKTNEHQFRSPVVSPQDYFDDIQRRVEQSAGPWSLADEQFAGKLRPSLS